MRVLFVQFTKKPWRSRQGDDQFYLVAVAAVDSRDAVKVFERKRKAEELGLRINDKMEFDYHLAVEHVLLEPDAVLWAGDNGVHGHHGIWIIHEAEIDRVCLEGLPYLISPRVRQDIWWIYHDLGVLH